MMLFLFTIMPNGADAVARAENGETIGKYVYVYSPVSHGKNVLKSIPVEFSICPFTSSFPVFMIPIDIFLYTFTL